MRGCRALGGTFRAELENTFLTQFLEIIRRPSLEFLKDVVPAAAGSVGIIVPLPSAEIAGPEAQIC